MLESPLIMSNGIKYVSIEFLLQFCENKSLNIFEKYGYDVKPEALNPFDSGYIEMINVLRKFLGNG